MAEDGGYGVFLYIPNVIGYIRLFIFLASSLYATSEPFKFIVGYTAAAALDFVDGYAARKLDQVSLFGSWLDVVVDVIQRGFLWTLISPYAYLIACVEWLTFVSNHSHGAVWKEKVQHHNQSTFIAWLTSNGFHTLQGEFILLSVHLFPIVIYCNIHDILPKRIPQLPILVFLAAGRLSALLVEVSVIKNHVFDMVFKG